MLKQRSKGRKTAQKIDGVVIGRWIGLDEAGVGQVEFPGMPSAKPMAARSLIPLRRKKLGGQVALQFENGSPKKPLILGFLHHPENDLTHDPVSVEMDGESLTFTAKKQVVLQCGKASLTLTRAGKILLRGAYVLSRSSGVNRIKGGSVEIN